ncbi:putative invertase inhibitor [Aristolochia californica]|uniref:putative invertase inhibitor n=1 Tax=Aristolochia californica TaxID=171875 RepID=UPI0035DD968B
MRFLPLLLCLLSFLLHRSFVIFTSSAPICNPYLVQKVCHEFAQSDPLLSCSFCINSLTAAPPGFSCNLRNLGVLSAQLALTNATGTVSRIQHLLRNGTWNPFEKECLSSCLDAYSDIAVPSLEKSIQAFGANRCQDANVRMSAAMDSSTTCQDGFGEKKGTHASPLTQQNYDLFQLCAISLAFSRHLC